MPEVKKDSLGRIIGNPYQDPWRERRGVARTLSDIGSLFTGNEVREWGQVSADFRHVFAWNIVPGIFCPTVFSLVSTPPLRFCAHLSDVPRMFLAIARKGLGTRLTNVHCFSAIFYGVCSSISFAFYTTENTDKNPRSPGEIN